nr:RidA family protein [Burkholderia perseverans]
MSTSLDSTRNTVFSPSFWEDKMGYARGKRVGNQVFIAGCVASDGNAEVIGDNAYDQTVFVIGKIEKYLNQLGARLDDVVSTTTHLTGFEHFDGYCRAFSERFSEIRPVNTTVAVKSLVKPEHVVEITAIAIVDD